MEAIILTYSPVPESEQELLKNTNVFKIALNHHAEEFKPNVRICSDYVLANICRNFPEKVISVRECFRFESDRVIKTDIEFKGSTIICAVEWLIKEGYDEILIIGDNTVNTKEFQEDVNYQIHKLNHRVKIYQYTKGNFPLPVRSITEFLSNVTNKYEKGAKTNGR